MISRLKPLTPVEDINDLRRRIAATRWPDNPGDDWSRGTRPSALRRLLTAWSDFDWAAVESRLHAETHLLAGDPGSRVHLWRTGTRAAPSVVLIHGWPDSFLRFRDVADELSDFDVIVPSIPGFAFSDPAPPDVGGPRWIAERILAALSEIDVHRFFVHGGDLGTAIAEQIALLAPDRVSGLHLSDVPLWRAAHDEHLTAEERAWVNEAGEWAQEEGAYAALQRTKPQTLAAGLTDSPAAIASWYLEKFQAWGAGDVFGRIPIDRLLENLSLHWFTRTAGSAARVYFDRRRFPPTGERVTVPTSFGVFPHDIDHGVESFARRWYPTVSFTRYPSGGHFGALENPSLLADDLRPLISARP